MGYNYSRKTAAARGRSNVYNGNNVNFSRSRAAQKYYSYSAVASKIDDERDRVSLKYYGKLVKIENKSVARGSAAKIFCALIICFCAILVVYTRSRVYNYQLENDAMTKNLEAEREQTASLRAQNTDKIDIAYVESEALTRLNMAKPQSYQIVYIEVPKTEYTVNHEAPTVIEKEKPLVISYKSFASGIKEAGVAFLPIKTDER